LSLLGCELFQLRPDLRTVHFTHTPFADPAALRMLPVSVAEELLVGMGGYHARGFHSNRWAAGYQACQRELGTSRTREGEGISTFTSALTPDPTSWPTPRPAGGAGSARQPGAGHRGADRQVIVRVDRMELSKNLLRGFWAFEELLEQRPQLLERVVFVAMAYPSRQGLAEYLAYQNEVESTVARINERWATPGWTPIVLLVEDDYLRSWPPSPGTTSCWSIPSATG